MFFLLIIKYVKTMPTNETIAVPSFNLTLKLKLYILSFSLNLHKTDILFLLTLKNCLENQASYIQEYLSCHISLHIHMHPHQKLKSINTSLIDIDFKILFNPSYLQILYPL